MNTDLSYSAETAAKYRAFSDDEFEGDKALFNKLAGLKLYGKLMLDFGCGNGRIEPRLLETWVRRIYGIDASAPMIGEAQNAASAMPIPIKSRLSFAHANGPFCFNDNTFDIIVCHFVLHYIKDTLPTIFELARVLLPGGLLVATVNDITFRAGFEHLDNIEMPLILKDSTTVKTLAKSAQEITMNLEKAGLIVVSNEEFSTASARIPEDFEHRDKISYKNALIVARKP